MSNVSTKMMPESLRLYEGLVIARRDAVMRAINQVPESVYHGKSVGFVSMKTHECRGCGAPDQISICKYCGRGSE